jgi:adenosine deaminase
MVDEYIAEARRQNIRYAEVHFTPYNHEVLGKFGARAAVELITERLQRAESAGGPAVRLIFDIDSASLPASGEYTTALVEQLANPILVAVGLGGPEVNHPRTAAAPYFERIRRAGYPVVAHAGETGPAEHVRQAVINLKARRVQHGVHAVDDAEVVRLLAEHGIACDVALTSNLLLTGFRDLNAHPIRRFLQAGVPVTLSTDDPAFFNTDLTHEYELARDEVGLGLQQLWDINLNGLRFGLAELPLRRRLLQQFLAEGAGLGLAPVAEPPFRDSVTSQP